jgi:hypothetical protein
MARSFSGAHCRATPVRIVVQPEAVGPPQYVRAHHRRAQLALRRLAQGAFEHGPRQRRGVFAAGYLEDGYPLTIALHEIGIVRDIDQL